MGSGQSNAGQIWAFNPPSAEEESRPKRNNLLTRILHNPPARSSLLSEPMRIEPDNSMLFTHHMSPFDYT